MGERSQDRMIERILCERVEGQRLSTTGVVFGWTGVSIHLSYPSCTVERWSNDLGQVNDIGQISVQKNCWCQHLHKNCISYDLPRQISREMVQCTVAQKHKVVLDGEETRSRSWRYLLTSQPSGRAACCQGDLCVRPHHL